MDTVCQACGYQRKPTDQAPDWECPSCGKAYAKTSHASPSPLVIYTDSLTTKVGNGARGGPSYRLTPSRSLFNGDEAGMNKAAMVLGLLWGLFFIVGIPVLTDPSSAYAIIFHGDVGFVLLLFLALMAVVAVFKRTGADVDVNDPKASFAFGAKFFGVVSAVLFMAFAMWSRNQDHVDTKIQQNGVREMADVVRIYNGGCGKRSCSIDVEYAFAPSSGAEGTWQLVHGYAHLGSTDRPNDPEVAYARTHRQVPIAYEVGHPDISALNFNDDIFRVDYGERSRSTTVLLGELFFGVFALILAISAAIFWSKSRRKSQDG